MGARYLITRVFTSEAIYEVTQYNFDVSSHTATPRYVNLPSQEDDLRGISGLESMDNTLKVVNIQERL